MPSTASATMTMVANTGWLIATRVIHMACGLAPGRGGAPGGRGGLLAGRPGGLRSAAEDLDCHAVLQVVELGREHGLGGLQPRYDLQQLRPLVAQTGRDAAPRQLVPRDHPDVGAC